MNTYCKLKTGEIKVVFSDNIEEETMHLFPLSDLEEGGRYNAENISCSVHRYDEIAVTDTNLAYLECLQKVQKEGHRGAVLRLGDDILMTGDAISIGIAFNNLSGQNFDSPEDHAAYLRMMERDLGVQSIDPKNLHLKEV